ncbi:hypothetical protein AVEN_251699-1 [Araneus ventricosus]|uniref:Uncharacterized protein n=1 Tax=Araneus ventricosus TaxID=182803 RepID=A0A4Y2NMJ5_ARAVE|nr:hypothetical protein AVEN_251699-1 [Araneus ventricosus]
MHANIYMHFRKNRTNIREDIKVSLKNPTFPRMNFLGCGGLVVRTRPRGRRFPGLKPDSTEEPPCNRFWCTSNPSGQMSSCWCGSLERGSQLRCRPLHLTAVQNYEVRSKIALVLLQNGT